VTRFFGCGQSSEDQSHGLQDHHILCPMTFLGAKLKVPLTGGLNSCPVYLLKQWITETVEAETATDVDGCVD
jgi:hypothetical protein